MEKTAYIVFILVMTVIFSKAIIETRNHGEQLRQLRTVCKQLHKVAGTDQESASIPLPTKWLLQNKKTGEISGTVEDDNDVVEFIQMASKLEDGRISFQHTADIGGTSHIVAVCKYENEDWLSVVYIDT